jgi:hypothetical protein
MASPMTAFEKEILEAIEEALNDFEITVEVSE